MIKGEKIRLRILERKDLEKTIKWFNDFEIVQPLDRLPFLTIEQEEEWYNNIMRTKNALILAIDTNEGVHIGNIALNLIDYRNGHAVISIAIGEKKYWSKGFGTDAIKTLINFAFHEMRLHKIYTHIIDSNKQSLKLFKKCGFEREGILRDWYFSKDKYHDRIIMSIIKHQNDFPIAKPSQGEKKYEKM
jgi:RimJ/RimL family protein N-acetyltransferase